MALKNRPLQLVRLVHINIILLRNRLDTVVLSTEALAPYRFISYFNPWFWFNRKTKPRGVALRLSIEQLGPVFVKFGQILSTRKDLLPPDIANELAKLQDRVPPIPGDWPKQLLEREYNQPIDKVFARFDLNPLASASIAQVHQATLPNGKEVVVKILKPNIEKVIWRDIGLLYTAATLTEYLVPQGKKLRLREVVAELEKSIRYELDLQHEGANASQLRRNFLNSSLLYIPEVFWEYSSKNVLVIERIDGVPISEIATLRQYGINLKQLAENGVDIFFTQVFRDSFFHADMHPGNIFVNKSNPSLAQYIAVDFGIMGTLSPEDQRYLAENLLAFFRRDYRRVAELHIKAGTVGTTVRLDDFETAIRGVCEPIFERPLKDISFGKLLLNVFEAAREFHLEVQPQFFLLQKTLLNIEGLGRQLYPDLDLWTTAKPYVEKWVKEQLGPRQLLNRIYKNMPHWLDKMIDLPDLVHSSLQRHLIRSREEQEIISKTQRKLQQRKWQGLGLGIFSLAILNAFVFHFYTNATIPFNILMASLGLVFVGMALVLR